MAEHSSIEWTDATWNVITGCSVVSPACTNCYAMRLAGTRLAHHPSRAGLTTMTKAGPVWNGQVRFNEEWLLQPLRWKRPRRIFVCAHADLFHEAVPDEWIDRVFAVMALAPQHTFQVLTKRPQRMREYLSDPRVADRIYDLVCDFALSGDADVILIAPGIDPAHAPLGNRVFLGLWPLPNVWLGVTAEDQERANERIPELLATPAALRFVSVEPMLGPIDLGRYLGVCWVIAGGESGPGARPSHPDWFRSLRDQCAAARVPFFFKQHGDWASSISAFSPDRPDKFIALDGRIATESAALADGGSWTGVWRVGKARAGRMLDGRTHDEFPEART